MKTRGCVFDEGPIDIILTPFSKAEIFENRCKLVMKFALERVITTFAKQWCGFSVNSQRIIVSSGHLFNDSKIQQGAKFLLAASRFQLLEHFAQSYARFVQGSLTPVQNAQIDASLTGALFEIKFVKERSAFADQILRNLLRSW